MKWLQNLLADKKSSGLEANPHNREILAFLKAKNLIEGVPALADSWYLPITQLQTHPDLMDWLEKAVAATAPPELRKAVYGQPVVITPNRVIFCIARGTHQILLRLKPADVTGGDIKPKKAAGLSEDWYFLEAWLQVKKVEDFLTWYEKARTYAVSKS